MKNKIIFIGKIIKRNGKIVSEQITFKEAENVTEQTDFSCN